MKISQKDYVRKLRNNILYLHRDRLQCNEQTTWCSLEQPNRIKFLMELGILGHEEYHIHDQAYLLLEKINDDKDLIKQIVNYDYSVYNNILYLIDNYLNNEFEYDDPDNISRENFRLYYLYCGLPEKAKEWESMMGK